MKKIILSIIGCAVAASGFAASRIVDAEMHSRILDAEKPFCVYLPDGYDENPDVHYPVLYLLHGAYGNCRDWVEKGNMQKIADEAIANGSAVPMIIVMPDARGIGADYAGEHMGYFDVDGWNYEQYFHQELIPHIDSNYRTIANRSGRSIAGLSMGGGGSVGYAQHHPNVYSTACSLSGALGNAPASSVKNNPQYIKSINANDQTKFVQNASKATLESLRNIRWWIDCGDDDFLWDSNTGFYRAMRTKNIPLEYRMRDGAHTWTYWSTGLPDVLRYVSEPHKTK